MTSLRLQLLSIYVLISLRRKASNNLIRLSVASIGAQAPDDPGPEA